MDEPSYGQEAGEEAAVAEVLRAGAEEASREMGLLSNRRQRWVWLGTWLLVFHCGFHWLQPSACGPP